MKGLVAMLASSYYLLFGSHLGSGVALFNCVDVVDEKDLDLLFEMLYKECADRNLFLRHLCEDQLDTADKLVWRRRWAECVHVIQGGSSVGSDLIRGDYCRSGDVRELHQLSNSCIEQIKATHARLTPEYAALADELADLRGKGASQEELARHMELWAAAHPEEHKGGTSAKPAFDPVSRQLSYRGEILRLFKRPAENQERIVKAFHEDRWPTRIDDPLQKGKLNQTIRDLNRSLKQPSIRFRADGRGEGVIWERAD